MNITDFNTEYHVVNFSNGMNRWAKNDTDIAYWLGRFGIEKLESIVTYHRN